MKKELTTWADKVIESAKRPKYTEAPRNSEIPKPEPCLIRNRRIVGLHGPLQSGKNTAAEVLIRNGYTPVAYADALRTQLYKLNPVVFESGNMLVRIQNLVDSIGWDEAKTKYPEVRRLMQSLGTEAGRDIHGEDCWVNIVHRYYDINFNDDYVATDVRFPNEVLGIHKRGGIVIRIERDGKAPDPTHRSEILLPNCDYVVTNNTTVEELHEKILEIVDKHFK